MCDLYVMTWSGYMPDRHVYDTVDEAVRAAIEYMWYYAADRNVDELIKELARRREENPRCFGIEGLVIIRDWRD